MVALSGRQNGQSWTLAPALVALVHEVDTLAPHRSTASDGSIGDASHAARDSDHNPKQDVGGPWWVDAVDLTDDPAHGADMTRLVALIVASRDERVKYIIHDGLVWRSYGKPGLKAWTPERYRGPNQHKTHAHFSVNAEHRGETQPWLEEDDMTDAERKAINARFDELEGKLDRVLVALGRFAHAATDDDAGSLHTLWTNVEKIKTKLGA